MWHSRTDYKKIMDAMGNWLEPYPWTWYGTFTFAKDIVSTETASRLFERCVEDLNSNVIYVRAIEWHKFRDCLHIHALVGNTKEMLIWKHGLSKIMPYNPKLGARYYIGKFSLSERADIDYRLNLVRKMF